MRWPLHFRLNVTGSGHRAPFCTEEQPGSGWTPVSRLVQNVSAVRRDKYEMNISPSHVRFGLWYQNTNPMDGRPGDCNPGSANFCRHNWVDQDINPPLPWNRAVLTFGHHSYDPCKDGAGCENTWHWGDVYVSNSIPFSINQGARWVKGGGPQTVTFAHPTVDNSFLRFEGISNTPIQYSLDGGATWTNAQQREIASSWRGDNCHARSYWTSIPAGVTSLQLRGTTVCGGSWIARDVTAWSPGVFGGELDGGTDAGFALGVTHARDAGRRDAGLDLRDIAIGSSQ